MHLYLHIPFCKQACHYCDFHFSTNQRGRASVVAAMVRELHLRADYLPTRRLETVYFGGGTPSILSDEELATLFSAIRNDFDIAPDAEITLEANPDDLTAEKLDTLRRHVNRLSIGIQTFDEAALRWMNRAHTAAEAEHVVALARNAGFDNLSADLIYGLSRPGLPGRSDTAWRYDLERFAGLALPHLSAYSLTIEPATAFGRWTATGKLPPADDDLAARHFEELVVTLQRAGYEHYEISNFASSGHYARHNTAYWQARPYLGIGPAAHSFDGASRQHNVANNARYVAALEQGEIPAEREMLTPADRVNEYLLTGLRTRWGCSVATLNELLGDDFLARSARALARQRSAGWLDEDNATLRLTDAGKLFADRVASELFV